MYEPITRRVLIIMLEALGDILITSPLPRRLKEEDPSTHVTWLVKPYCRPLVEMNRYVDRILDYDWEAVATLSAEKFSKVIALERTPAAAVLGTSISTEERVGIGWSSELHSLVALSSGGERILMLDTWNDFRTKINTITWVQLYLEVSGLEYRQDPYELQIPFWARQNVSDILFQAASPRGSIAVNLGASFTQKTWPLDNIKALCRRLVQDEGLRILLIGGEAERVKAEAVIDDLPDCEGQFVSFVGEPLAVACAAISSADVLVTADSFAYHVGLAADIPSVVLFGPSAPNEVVPPDSKTVVLTSNWKCSPCAHQMSCFGRGGCMSDIGVQSVVDAILQFLPEKDGGSR